MKYEANTLESVLTIDKIYSIHYFCYAKDFSYGGEAHDFCELVYVDSGEVTVINGEDKFILKQGEGFFHQENIYHNIYPNNNFANIAIISFECLNTPDLENRVLKFGNAEKNLINNILNEGRLCFEEPLNLVFLEKMTKRINPPYACEQIIKNSLEMLLITLSRTEKNSGEKTSDAHSTQKNISDEIISLLNKNVNLKLTLNNISKTLGYSVSYLKKIFKSVNNTSIINYFISLKILEAKKYISENVPISLISDMLAFDSIQYFSRCFKQHTNMTPTQYRKSAKILKVL